jgi:hypothetical protein
MKDPYVFELTPDKNIALVNSQRKQIRLQNKPAKQTEEECKAKGKLSEIPRMVRLLHSKYRFSAFSFWLTWRYDT